MTASRERIVVLGADAAGMSAAHQALRMASSQGREIEVVAIERSSFTSYSACGLPYWVAGEVESYDELVARSPERHRAMGIDLRTGTTATGVDLDRRSVCVEDERGAEWIDFDQLVVATGASPVMPDWAKGPEGRLIRGIAALKDPDDGRRWIERLRAPEPGGGRSPLVIAGGGYIGVEMAEAALARGWPVVLITRTRVMSGMEPAMSERIADTLRAAGVTVIAGDPVVSVSSDGTGAVSSVRTSAGETVDCSAVLVAMGVRANVGFLGEGFPRLGPSGALVPDARGELLPGVWAAGDCCESLHRVSGQSVHVPLGTHANKQGRVVGTNLMGGTARFEGVLGTGISRFDGGGEVYVEMAKTGLSVSEAERAGFEPIELSTEGRTASGYMEASAPIAVSVIADRGSRRLLGAQIAGGRQAAKRIDTVAASLWGHLTVDDLAAMDLAYAPPFATVWEAVQLAARRLADRMS